MSTILESDIILCEDLLQAKLFDQIRIKKDTRTVKFLSYILTKEDGYREEALSVDDTIMAAVLVFLSEMKKKEKQNGNKD